MVNLLGSLTGFVWGIASDEVGINAERISLKVDPEINEWVPRIDGQSRGKVVGDPMGELTIEGETASSNTGILGATFVTAFIPVNSANFFGRTAGGFYLDTGTIERSRSALQRVTAQFSSRFNVP